MNEPNKRTDLAADDAHVSRVSVFEHVAVGQWYWVLDGDEKGSDSARWLACVMEVGSNYLKLQEPTENSGHRHIRVHLDDFWKMLERVDNPDEVIGGLIARHTAEASAILGEIKAITARLGVSTHAKLGSNATDDGSRALAVLSGQMDVKAYQQALTVAQKETLPELFKRAKAANAQVLRWMSARALPMEAAAEGMTGAIGDIKDRLFNVSLYAGLTEEVIKVADGAPADFGEKLHVMQLKQFMDEECLANYQHGGMEFRDIGQFDAWLSKPENRDRVLPFPRCLVAMQVRRKEKERRSDSLSSALVNIRLGEMDKLTFLYIRNGEQLYCLQCDLEFGELLFPARGAFNPTEPMMACVDSYGTVKDIITRADYESRLEKRRVRQRQHEEWLQNNPKPEGHVGPWDWDSPYYHRGNDELEEWYGKWYPFDPSSVYYDDIVAHVAAEVKQYNRIATIIQGLFDRSEVLHPHPPVRTWTPDGFAAAIELVYDGSDVLHNGDAPDFEAYRRQLNATLGTGSITIGQDDYWAEREAEKETERRRGDWRLTESERYRELRRFRPIGNPGPGKVAAVEKWLPNRGEAVFTWTRQRQRDGGLYSGKRYGDPLPCKVTVPASRLFNVSAYTPGDYKRFFADRRTRALYLKWADVMLTAEEFHSGNVQVGSARRSAP